MILTARLQVEVEVEDGLWLWPGLVRQSAAESAVIIVGKAEKFLPVKRLWKISNFNRH